MSPRRNTTTGGVLEKMVLPALDQGGYSTASLARGESGIRAERTYWTMGNGWTLARRTAQVSPEMIAGYHRSGWC